MAVLVAGTAALLGVPRSVPPGDIPEPVVAPAALSAALAADVARASRVAALAAQGKLEFDVRSLGDAVRAFGRAEVEEDEAALERAHRSIVDAAHRAIARDPELVLGLRAHQTRAFLREMRAFERTGQVTAELGELAGTFARSAELYGWYDRPARRLLPDEAALAAMYKKRWNEVTGLTGPAFALSLDEERALHRFLIAHPAVVLAPLPAGASAEVLRARAIDERVAADERRLEKIRELGKMDAAFPEAFAEGVVLFRLGRFEAAAVAFDRHLHASPDGPWTLRARNFLKASLEAR